MEQAPNDLITLTEAQELVNRSRTWIMSRVRQGKIRLWEQAGAYKVSKAAIIAANEEYSQLKPKDLTDD